MTRRIVIAMTLVVAVALGLTADASARLGVHRLHPRPKAQVHRSSVPAPVVTSVTPLKTNVGQKLTILGKNFTPGKNQTKVFFLRQGGGITSASAEFATKTRLVVTIPETVTPLLRGTGRTRFQIRILTSRYGDSTKLLKSPLIGPGSGGPVAPPAVNSPLGDCDHNGVKNKDQADDDSDLVDDATEITVTHTDPCKKDTDGDTISDGYEWQAATDMNNTTPFNVPDAALPFPGKKPWPNPLDASDAGIDHDGDGLSMIDEWQLYRFYGHNSPTLNYSDGKQVSVTTLAPADPVLDYMDMNDDGVLSDDERDGDGDGLGNWDEKYGRMTQGWWDAIYDGSHGPKESHYYLVDPSFPDRLLDFPAVSHVDPDSDGDGVLDGADDQDHDGLSNAFEISRPWDWDLTYVSDAHPGANHSDNPELYQDFDPAGPLPVGVGPNPWARVQPFNPCKPVTSETCHLHPAIGYYPTTEDWHSAPGWLYGSVPAAPWKFDAADYADANGPKGSRPVPAEVTP